MWLFLELVVAYVAVTVAPTQQYDELCSVLAAVRGMAHVAPGEHRPLV